MKMSKAEKKRFESTQTIEPKTIKMSEKEFKEFKRYYKKMVKRAFFTRWERVKLWFRGIRF